MKITKKLQCQWIIQPGELMINTWDNKQCTETDRQFLLQCEECGQHYCTMFGHHIKHDRTHDAR